jgi:hypothetical protein
MEATRSERVDAFTVIAYGVGAAIVVAIGTWMRVLQVFRDDGIAWVIPIDHQPIAAIIGSIGLWALTALVVIGAVLIVASNFLRSRFFVGANVRAFTTIGWTLSIGPLLILGLKNVAQNGVLAAAGWGEGESLHPIEFWAVLPVLAAGIAVGLIATAFRRSIRLQSDTEGLV